MFRKHIQISVLLFLAAAIQVWGDNKARSVSVDVKLDSLGGAWITETWDVNINSSNTEWYLSLSDLRNGIIRDLSVKELGTGQAFTCESSWDVKRSREQKAGRCGIIDKGDGDYEICWGIGSDGDHVWEVNYYYENLVTAFTDSCAFNHMFVSDGLSSPPEKARVEIGYPGIAISDSIASAWAFGFDGTLSYSDSTIVAESDAALSSSEGIIVMVAFDPSLFSTQNTSIDSFSAMKSLALDGSDYTKENDSHHTKISFLNELLILLALIVLGIAGFILYFLLQLGFVMLFYSVAPLMWGIVTLHPLRVWFRRQRALGNNRWYKYIPDGKDLSRVPYVLNRHSYNVMTTVESYDKKLTAAYVMRLLNENALKISNGEIHVQQHWQLADGKYGKADSDAMITLYKILKAASGKDRILQKDEIKEYRKKEGMDLVKAFYSFRKLAGYSVDKTETRQILGLQNYLEDFTLSGERSIPEVSLWNEYLVYATLFGTAEKVIREMKKAVPDYPLLSQVTDESGLFLVSGPVIVNLNKEMKSVYKRAKAADAATSSYGGSSSRSSGGGGRSSYSGGGGHSGGGGGGGR